MSSSSEFIVKSAAYLDPELLASEPELIPLKWPEYRSWTPFQCNLHFAQTFRECFKDMIAKHVDYTKRDAVKGLDLRFWTSPETPRNDPSGIRKSVHRARHHADRLGLPYEDFIRFSMEFHANRSCKNIAQPNQLIPRNPDTLKGKHLEFRPRREKIWNAYWASMKAFAEDRLKTKLARYRAENPNPKEASPGCLGVAPLSDKVPPTCAQCRFATKCQTVSQIVCRKVDELTVAGLPTWKKEDQRKRTKRTRQSAERQRRFRVRTVEATYAGSAQSNV